MSLRKLEQRGSGVVLDVTRERVLQLAPYVYTATWEAILNGQGKYVVVLGVGTAEREVFFGLEGKDLSRYKLPTIHCYDIAEKPPQRFFEKRRQFPDIDIQYFPGTDLNTFKLPAEYIDNTRLICLHGVLDYLTPKGIKALMYQLSLIKPNALSFRLCLIRGNWLKCFVTPEQLKDEQDSIDKLKKGAANPVSLEGFLTSGIIQIAVSSEEKLKHNLSTDYPASFILPGELVGFLVSEGYERPLIEKYSDDMNSLLLLFMEKKA